MRKIISSLIIAALCFFSIPTAFGSPLVFKTSKRVESSEQVALGTIDAARLSRIRIALALAQKTTGSRTNAEIELNSAKREFERVKESVEQGNSSRLDFDRARNRLDKAQATFDSASPTISIYAMEGTDEILLMQFDDVEKLRSLVVESPPSKLIIKVAGKGDYKLFVWGQ